MPSAAPNARDAIIDAFKATTEELGREGHTLTDIYPALVDFVAAVALADDGESLARC